MATYIGPIDLYKCIIYFLGLENEDFTRTGAVNLIFMPSKAFMLEKMRVLLLSDSGDLVTPKTINKSVNQSAFCVSCIVTARNQVWKVCVERSYVAMLGEHHCVAIC